MALRFKILDERNTSTNVQISDFRFYSGENRTLRVQVVDEVDNNPYYITVGGTITFTLPGSPSNISKSGTISGTNASIATASLSQADTTSMTSGNLVAEIVEGANKRIVRNSFALNKFSKVPV